MNLVQLVRFLYVDFDFQLRLASKNQTLRARLNFYTPLIPFILSGNEILSRFNVRFTFND